MSATDKNEILKAVKGYFASFSDTKPPLTDTRKYVELESFAVISRPGSLVQCTMGELIDYMDSELSKAYGSGIGSIVTNLLEDDESKPEVWVRDRLAAVWARYQTTADGKEVERGACALTLLKREGEVGWKIGGVADTKNLPDATAAPPTAEEEAATAAEVLQPALDAERFLNKKNWDEIMKPRLPGGGATIARDPKTVTCMLFPELIEKMSAMAERAPGYVEHKMFDWEVRSVGDLGIVFAPFNVSLDGKLRITGCGIDFMLKKDGKWLISGVIDG
ncbi:hypothetical protein BX600DRAFT_438313 [Xylariales sp. PMI_506]|nr:hypothetical protein BX600DRAFT_438313 [Xylariales sp. PMI_506]